MESKSHQREREREREKERRTYKDVGLWIHKGCCERWGSFTLGCGFCRDARSLSRRRDRRLNARTGNWPGVPETTFLRHDSELEQRIVVAARKPRSSRQKLGGGGGRSGRKLPQYVTFVSVTHLLSPLFCYIAVTSAPPHCILSILPRIGRALFGFHLRYPPVDRSSNNLEFPPRKVEVS